ncbi:MAG: hypothetical protein NTW80_08990, partial [Deltaproteobacteria bacterium]|nr:hypothetical protein [Deltaproteobacteria bacterium]
LNALEVAGIPTVAVGLTNPPPDADYQIQRSRRGNKYRKLVCRGAVQVGALLVGDIDGAGVYAGLIRGRSRIGQLPEALDHPGRIMACRLSSTISKAKRVGSRQDW